MFTPSSRIEVEFLAKPIFSDDERRPATVVGLVMITFSVFFILAVKGEAVRVSTPCGVLICAGSLFTFDTCFSASFSFRALVVTS